MSVMSYDNLVSELVRFHLCVCVITCAWPYASSWLCMVQCAFVSLVYHSFEPGICTSAFNTIASFAWGHEGVIIDIVPFLFSVFAFGLFYGIACGTIATGSDKPNEQSNTHNRMRETSTKRNDRWSQRWKLYEVCGLPLRSAIITHWTWRTAVDLSYRQYTVNPFVPHSRVI